MKDTSWSMFNSGYGDPWMVAANNNFESSADAASEYGWIMRLPEGNYDENKTLAFVIQCDPVGGCGTGTGKVPLCEFYDGNNRLDGIIETTFHQNNTFNLWLVKKIDKEVKLFLRIISMVVACDFFSIKLKNEY